MATTIRGAFDDFRVNLEITDKQTQLISSRRVNIVTSLQSEFQIQSSLLTGSYVRDTMIRYLYEGDVDLFVILDYGVHKSWYLADGTVAVLDEFRKLLSSTYPKVAMRRDRFCITMKFDEFRFDIVPAFEFNLGGYVIPDTYKREWIRTNPPDFANKMSNLNKRLGGMVKPLLKMLKAWNRNNGWLIKSYHLECMVYQQLANVYALSDYPQAVSNFFKSASTALLYPTYEPVYGTAIDDGRTWANQISRDNLMMTVALASSATYTALQQASDGYIQSAISQWKSIFGQFFPNWG